MGIDAEYRRRFVTWCLLLPGVMACTGCTDPLVRKVERFKAARTSGDVETAQALLADDARSWWETKEGPGSPLKAKKSRGRWSDWDEYFNSQVTYGPYVVEDRTVSYTITEINDWYRLVDRPPSQARYIYYFDDDDRICGKLFEPIRENRPPDRYDEAEAWIRGHYPDDIAYLLPDGNIDPALEKAKRWRELLIEWRQETGLPPIE